MKHINLDAFDEVVKQFILSLSPDPGGFILEVGGQPVADILAVPATAEVVDWNAAMDARRCALIDREIAGLLTTDEAAELRTLQAAMLCHRRRVAPLPIDEARRLHRNLSAKVAGSSDV